MVAPAQVRNSGKTVAEETLGEISKEADTLPDLEGESRRSKFRTPGFSRMRIDWLHDDQITLSQAKTAAEARLVKEFLDAFQVLNRIYDLVRKPVMGPDGPERDRHGFVVWAKDEYGNYDEDWERLTGKERDNLLFAITTRMVDWEQRSADAWSEAMYSKGMWEERYSNGFDGPMEGTVQDREAKGRIFSTEERYFAIALTSYSRKTEALVRSMQLIGQRLRDSLYSGR